MELRVPARKSDLYPIYAQKPHEMDFSDEDDDDRNHKHRRRDASSPSGMDSPEPILTTLYKKRKPFENGHEKENESLSHEKWKNQANVPSDKANHMKFGKRRQGLVQAPIMALRSNQVSGRGRGKDPGFWNGLDSRFISVDIAQQMVQRPSIAPNHLIGTGIPSVPNPQGATWNAFGLLPAVRNCGLDSFPSIGFQGTLALTSTLNVGISRQRCRDFEERGFCLRGDTCPMEHGVNRIVVEDVQSLSQFDLPVSVPKTHIVGAPAVPLPPPSICSVPPVINVQPHSKPNQSPVQENMSGLSSSFYTPPCSDEADVYDPDQPLWNSNSLETADENKQQYSPRSADESTLGADHTKGGKCATDEPVNAHSSHVCASVWGRIGDSKNGSSLKEKVDMISSSEHFKSEADRNQEFVKSQSKQMAFEESSRHMASFTRSHDSFRPISRKPSQKAVSTLFLTRIPQESNQTQTLFSHFKKFGHIVDIFIPLNSDRAFVQFSKREEAEAALRSPEAVMGNRFIRVLWANRDCNTTADTRTEMRYQETASDVDTTIASASNRVVATDLTPRISSLRKSVAAQEYSSTRVKQENCLPNSPCKSVGAPKPEVATLSALKPSPKTVVSCPKVPSTLEKKLDTLGQLKDDIRKKQEMLDKKRNDFRLQLEKLEKQATSIKRESQSKSNTKPTSASKATPSNSGDGFVASQALGALNSTACYPDTVPSCGTGTSFRVLPPLPLDLANVTVLKRHFSAYGSLLDVELEETLDSGKDGSSKPGNHSARVTFGTRDSAESAFLKGTAWEGHQLCFSWLPETAPSNSAPHTGSSDPPASAVPCAYLGEHLGSKNENPEVSEAEIDVIYLA